MLNVRGLKDVFAFVLPKNIMSHNQTTALMGSFSNTCKDFHTLFHHTLIDRAIIALYQAVIDNNENKVKIILNPRPELLLLPLPQNFIIESKLTWQKFYVEDALTMAAKRKQLNMIKLLLPYYQALKLDNLIKQAFAAWITYENNNYSERKIIFPDEYLSHAKYLITVFAEENFPNGKNGLLSEKTESVLSLLFSILLPKQAVRLDEYLDTELFLLTVCQAYRNYFNAFRNWDQREAFCIRVMGLIQSTFQPETGKFFCESLQDVVKVLRMGKEIVFSQQALSYQLRGGENFYRSSRESRSGLGFNFLCGVSGSKRAGSDAANGLSTGCFNHAPRHSVLENLCQKKQHTFDLLQANVYKDDNLMNLKIY